MLIGWNRHALGIFEFLRTSLPENWRPFFRDLR
jgi:hypothetical protein